MAANRAGVLVGEQGFLAALHIVNDCATFGEANRSLKGVGQALLQVGTGFDAVNHDIHTVFLIFRELGVFVTQLDQLGFIALAFGTNTHAHKTLRL